MMPPGHIAATWGAAALLQKNNPRLTLMDYRLLALCAMLPDIIDKPLAILVFTEAHTSQLLAHSLLFNAVLLVITLLWWPSALPYVLTFNGHLILDRMWNHTESFWWPMFGWPVFWEFKPMNTPETMFNVYIDIITRYPQVWVIEILAILFFVCFFYHYRLYQCPTLKNFMRSGRINSSRPENDKDHFSSFFTDNQNQPPLQNQD